MFPTLIQSSLIILFGCILDSLVSLGYICIVNEYLEKQQWVPLPPSPLSVGSLEGEVNLEKPPVYRVSSNICVYVTCLGFYGCRD